MIGTFDYDTFVTGMMVGALLVLVVSTLIQKSERGHKEGE